MPEAPEQQERYLPLRRAETAAGFVLVVQVAAGLVALLLARYCGSAAAMAEAWHLLVGIVVWLVVLVHQRLRRVADEEAHEVRTLQERRARDGSQSLFEQEQELDLFAARNRLAQFEKYFLPAFSILLVVGLGGLSGYLLWALRQTVTPGTVVQPLMTAVVFVVGIAFVSFLLAKYTAGLATQKAWRALRAGASYSMSCALGSLLVGIGLGLYHFEVTIVDRIVAYAIPIVLALMALEVLLNQVLAIYRPRVAGQEERAAYDSRLLGMLVTSRGLLRTTAETLDYQFGFKVSETWFYRFMERAIAPLILFQLLTLWLLTCFIVVETGEEAVIERFGRPLRGREALGPGLHVKWPWPVDVAQRYPVKRVQMIMVGEQLKEELGGYLWTVAHTHRPFSLLVANEASTPGAEAQPEEGEPAPPEASEVVPVSLLSGTIYVYYAVKEGGLYDYLYNYREPKAALDAVCYRELTRYAVSADFLKLLGAKRGDAATALRDSFQERADEMKLGVDIVGVSLQGIHPPVEIGETFQDVVGAVEDAHAEEMKAEAYANEQVPAARARARRTELEAKAYKKKREVVSEARAYQFEKQLTVFRVAERVFMYRKMLEALVEALAGRRVVLRPHYAGDVHEVIIIDVDPPTRAPIMDLFGGETEGGSSP